MYVHFFFQAEDGIRDYKVTGVQTCALPICMNEMGLVHNRAYRKSAKIVGEIMGNYHPHGDAAIYDTLVRMAQDFNMRYCLVDSQGNFGSVDGDPPAAMRYTEARLTKLAEEMLADIDKETVDFRPNYDESRLEPLVLPAKAPNLLINGAGGIAVGYATNIPTHNLAEVVDGLIRLIDIPDTTIEGLMELIPGPDFPTAGYIYGGRASRRPIPPAGDSSRCAPRRASKLTSGPTATGSL